MGRHRERYVERELAKRTGRATKPDEEEEDVIVPDNLKVQHRGHRCMPLYHERMHATRVPMLGAYHTGTALKRCRHCWHMGVGHHGGCSPGQVQDGKRGSSRGSQKGPAGHARVRCCLLGCWWLVHTLEHREDDGAEGAPVAKLRRGQLPKGFGARFAVTPYNSTFVGEAMRAERKAGKKRNRD